MLLYLFLAAVAVPNSQFGQGEGDVLSDSFACSGTESSLGGCIMNMQDQSCIDTAGVVCFPGGSK